MNTVLGNTMCPLLLLQHISSWYYSHLAITVTLGYTDIVNDKELTKLHKYSHLANNVIFTIKVTVMDTDLLCNVYTVNQFHKYSHLANQVISKVTLIVRFHCIIVFRTCQ